MADLLYGIYSVVSNKTVRKNENFYIKWKNHNKNIPGKVMVRTNRGYFIDGHNVDERSTALWFNTTGNDRSYKPKKK